MTTFALAPGNTRHAALRVLINTPRQRVQRVIQVTRSWWFSEQPNAHAEPSLVGPGGRPLTRRLNRRRNVA